MCTQVCYSTKIHHQRQLEVGLYAPNTKQSLSDVSMLICACQHNHMAAFYGTHYFYDLCCPNQSGMCAILIL